MRSSDIHFTRLLRLNACFADGARYWRWVVACMDQVGFDDTDEAYSIAVQIRDALLRGCRVTHRLLQPHQIADYRKAASAGRKCRAAARDRRQLGGD